MTKTENEIRVQNLEQLEAAKAAAAKAAAAAAKAFYDALPEASHDQFMAVVAAKATVTLHGGQAEMPDGYGTEWRLSEEQAADSRLKAAGIKAQATLADADFRKKLNRKLSRFTVTGYRLKETAKGTRVGVNYFKAAKRKA